MIKREKIIAALKEYKADPELIEAIANIYQDDFTNLQINEEIEQLLPVTSGIKQGCTGSTALFKLITYMIIRELEESKTGFKSEKFSLGSLFFADDGLILAQSVNEAKECVKNITRISAKYGLDINTEKSEIMTINIKEGPNEIEGIKVVENIKYLGIKVNSGRQIFRKQKEDLFEKAQKLANTTYSIIAKSCNRLLIGKTYWKCLSLPAFLYGTSLINFTEKEIERLQRIENGVYRQILQAPTYAPVCTLRGEIGSSSMKSRLIKDRFMYLRSVMEGENDLLKEIVREMIHEDSSK